MASILVVEDDSLVRELLIAALRQAGHAVVVAENGLEGLAALERAVVDLVIVDLVMPIMNGVEMITALRQRDRELPVVAMSGGQGGGQGPTLTGAIEAGADEALPKPFRVRDLMAVVSRHLNLPAV